MKRSRTNPFIDVEARVDNEDEEGEEADDEYGMPTLIFPLLNNLLMNGF
jgi:hypothetical protein